MYKLLTINENTVTTELYIGGQSILGAKQVEIVEMNKPPSEIKTIIGELKADTNKEYVYFFCKVVSLGKLVDSFKILVRIELPVKVFLTKLMNSMVEHSSFEIAEAIRLMSRDL